MAPSVAITLLHLAVQVREGKKRLPLEIVEVNAKIEKATRDAELFIIRFRVVDEGMVNKVVALMLERDRLYALWAESETSEAVVH